MSRSADERPTWTSGSGEIEPIEVHDLVPRGHEVVHELLPRVVARVDLRECTQFGVRTEDEVGAAAGPLELAGHVVAALERRWVWSVIDTRTPRRAQVEQVHEEVVGQRLGCRGEDAERGLLEVRAQDAEAAHEDARLGSAQGQQVRL